MTRKSFLYVCFFIAGVLLIGGCSPKDEPVENNASSVTQATTVTSEQTSILQPSTVAELPTTSPSVSASTPLDVPEPAVETSRAPEVVVPKTERDCSAIGGGPFTNDGKNFFKPPDGKTVVGINYYPGACYDSVVIDVQSDDPEIGYMVNQENTVFKRVSGDPLRLYGKVNFEFDVWANADNGKFHGYEFNANWETFQEVRYAESADGQTTFGVSLNKFARFNVVQEREGNITHVIARFEH